MRKLLIGAGALVLAALLTVYALWWAPGPKPGPHTVIIKDGTTVASVARQLQQGRRDTGDCAGPIMRWRGCSVRMTRSRPASSASRRGHGRSGDSRAAAARQAAAAPHHRHRRHARDHRPGEARGGSIFVGAAAADRGRIGTSRQLRLSARRDSGGARPADAGGDDEGSRRAMGEALDRLPDRDEGAGGDARVDRREGDGQGFGAAGDRRGVLQSLEDRHEARCGPDRYLPRDQGQAARPAHPALRARS